MLLRMLSVTGDRKVDKGDIMHLSSAICSTLAQPNWNPSLGINGGNIVNAKDLNMLSLNFGKRV
jgi:hypothetical protein